MDITLTFDADYTTLLNSFAQFVLDLVAGLASVSGLMTSQIQTKSVAPGSVITVVQMRFPYTVPYTTVALFVYNCHMAPGQVLSSSFQAQYGKLVAVNGVITVLSGGLCKVAAEKT